MTCRGDLRLLGICLAALLTIPAVSAAPTEDALERAGAALAAGDGIAAEVAARSALDGGEPRPEVAAAMGEALLLQGDLAGARKWLGPGAFAPAELQRGCHALARLELADGNPDAALAAFDKAVAAGPPDAALWVHFGRFRYQQGEHLLALEASNKALAADPHNPRALEFRAQIERDSRGLLAALPWFERGLKAAPEDRGLLGEYAATLGEAGRMADMLKTVRQIVKLDGSNPRAFYLQAVLAARAGKDDLARRLLWRTDGAFDAIPASLLLTGVLEMRSGNSALAVEKFAELARMQPDNNTARLLLGRALLANGEANEVIARLGSLADRDDASPYLLTLVGRAYEQLDRRADAAPYLDRAGAGLPQGVSVLPLAPGSDLAIWQARGDGDAAVVPTLRKLLAEDEKSQALRRAHSLSERYSGSADVAVLSGDVALLAGDPAQAFARYRIAQSVRFDRSLALRMAATLQGLGRPDEGRSLLRSYLTQHPRDRVVAAALGRSAAERGEQQEALALLFYASRLGGGPGDPYLLADLAKLRR